MVRSLDCGMGTAPIEQSELRTTSPTRALVVKMGARGGDFRAHMRAISALPLPEADSGDSLFSAFPRGSHAFMSFCVYELLQRGPGRGPHCSRPGRPPCSQCAHAACPTAAMRVARAARDGGAGRPWPLGRPAPRARVAAREAPFAAELKGAPIAARRPRRRTSLSCPGQRGGRGGLVTCGQAAPGDGGWVEPKAPRRAEHRGVGGPRVQRAGSCCLIDNVVHWTPSLPQV